jgi:hypothetical protein
LVQHDQELWTYSLSNSRPRVDYNNVADFLAGKALGVRSVAAAPISSYTFAKLVADPVRSRLYGLDTAKQLVVSIDSSSLAPVGAIIVGSTPTDIEIDASANHLYVGHQNTQGIADIDLANWSFVRFLPTPRSCGDIAVVGNAKIVAADTDQWSTPDLIDAVSGNLLHEINGPYAVALSATTDGNTVFISGSGSASAVSRLSVATGQFVGTSVSVEYSGVARSVVATPDGTGVYFAGKFFDGNNLSTVRYALTDQIRTVTPNGLLATSANSVYRVSDGAMRGTLTTGGAVQAASADSSKLFVATGTAIVVNDLSAF